jgi:hypothetical protein
MEKHLLFVANATFAGNPTASRRKVEKRPKPMKNASRHYGN